MPERIILALKLSSTVHGTSTSDRKRREAPDEGPDHEIYQKSSHFCGYQEVCEEFVPILDFTAPGMYIVYKSCTLCIYTCSVQWI